MAINERHNTAQPGREGDREPDTGRGDPKGDLQRRPVEDANSDAVRTAAAAADEEKIARHNLNFKIEVNRRYLERRRRFFDFMGKLLAFINIAGGSAVFSTFFSGNTTYALVAGSAVAVASLLDLVFRFDSMAQKMHEQYRRNTELQKKIAALLTMTPGQRAEFEAIYFEIAADDPAPFQVLVMMCHNEACGAIDAFDHMKHIARPRRWLAQIIDLPPVRWLPMKFGKGASKTKAPSDEAVAGC